MFGFLYICVKEFQDSVHLRWGISGFCSFEWQHEIIVPGPWIPCVRGNHFTFFKDKHQLQKVLPGIGHWACRSNRECLKQVADVSPWPSLCLTKVQSVVNSFIPENLYVIILLMSRIGLLWISIFCYYLLDDTRLVGLSELVLDVKLLWVPSPKVC